MGRKKQSKQVLSDSAPLRCIGYMRVSTQEQVLDGLSLRSQEHRIRSYCEGVGYTLLSVVQDAGLSGALRPHKRPALWAALTAIREGRADGIVFTSLDRLSRSVGDILDLTTDASKRGWQLISINERLDTGTAGGKFVLTMYAALAQMERERISERTKVGIATLRRQNRPVSNVLPFGWRVEGLETVTKLTNGQTGKLVPYPPEAALVRRMQALSSQGLGVRRIANTLNAAGTLNPRSNKPWADSGVASILRTAEKRAKGT